MGANRRNNDKGTFGGNGYYVSGLYNQSIYTNEIGEKVGEINYSPLSYAYSVLSAYPTDDEVHDNVRNLVKSLYYYNI